MINIAPLWTNSIKDFVAMDDPVVADTRSGTVCKTDARALAKPLCLQVNG